MYREEEKLCLKWNDFQENTISAFGTLREDREFADVTLACEDGQQVEAHKVILAASSPFFQKLLSKNKHPHPLIYMRGLKSEDLVAIVDFLYFGEANVYQENIDSFLAIAEELNLKGLTGNGYNVEKEESVMSSGGEEALNLKKRQKPKPEHHKAQESKPFKGETDFYEESTETALAVPNFAVSTVDINEIKMLDEQVRSTMTKSQNTIPNGPNLSKKAEMCTVCGKEGRSSNIKDHIEANHLEGVSLPCNYCQKTFRSRNALRQHNTEKHKTQFKLSLLLRYKAKNPLL